MIFDGNMWPTCIHCRKGIKCKASLSSHLGWEPVGMASIVQLAGHRLGQRRVKSGSVGQRENNHLTAVFDMR